MAGEWWCGDAGVVVRCPQRQEKVMICRFGDARWGANWYGLMGFSRQGQELPRRVRYGQYGDAGMV